MTERENFLLMMNGEKPEWPPCFYSAYDPVGSSLLNNQGEYMKGGKDMFGVEWICTPDTGYQAIADPRKHLLEEMEGWQDVIHFPDLDAGIGKLLQKMTWQELQAAKECSAVLAWKVILTDWNL